MQYGGFVPDIIIMGKAAQTAMILANRNTVADSMPPTGATTSPVASLLRTASVMEAMLTDTNSPYCGIASRISEHHSGVLRAIRRCIAAEQAAQGIGQPQVAESNLWRRCMQAMDAGSEGGTKMPLVWGGGLVFFCHEGVSDAVFAQLQPGTLGQTSKVMRAIITFRPAIQLGQWLDGPVWSPRSADAHTAKKPRR